MGREAACSIRWRGASTEGIALLESTELILRGDIKARIPRGDISEIAVKEGVLTLVVKGEALELDLGQAAAAWEKALHKAPPTLAEKLGIGSASRVFVVGTVSDPVLQAAIGPAQTQQLGEAKLLLAEFASDADLAAGLAFALLHKDMAIWCCYPKGAKALPADGQVRGAFRGAGYMDTKACAVSDRLTATRYSRPKSAAGARQVAQGA